MSFDRRNLLAAASGGTARLATRCMTKALRSPNADGTYCYRIGKSYRPKLTGTPGPVHSAAVELQARAFSGSAESFARLRLAPAQHVLTATWPEGTAGLETSGKAGEVLVVEVTGQVWVWGSKCRLEPGTIDDARERTRNLRLVADVG